MSHFPDLPCPWCKRTGHVEITTVMSLNPGDARIVRGVSVTTGPVRPLMTCRARGCGLELLGYIAQQFGEDVSIFPEAPPRLPELGRVPVRIPTQQWLSDAAHIVRANVRERFPLDSCITSTRIMLDCLRRNGIPTVPDPVSVFAHSADRWVDMAQRLEAGKPLTPDMPGSSVGIQASDEITPAAQRSDRPGVSKTRGWNGHLLCRTEPISTAPDVPSYLVDLAVDQLHRPDWGIEITGPVVTKVYNLDGWRDGDTIGVELSGGAIVTWARAAQLTLWKHAALWVAEDPTVTMITAQSMADIAEKLPAPQLLSDYQRTERTAR